MKPKSIMSAAVLTALSALAVVLVACSDPPPPSLGHVGIEQVYDNTGNTSITYVYSDVANCRGREGSVSKGITIGDGVTVALSFSRRINDPPEDDKQARALLDKPFTFVPSGDAFTITKPTQANRIILTTAKPGEGSLVISVDGASGSVSLPIRIVEQSAVPENVDESRNCEVVVPDAGSPSSDGGAEASTSDDAG